MIGVAERTFLLSDTYRLHAEFTEVGGLMPGASVQYQGVGVGRVDFVQLPSLPGDPIRVGLSIRSDARHLVRSDSRATIQTEGLVGNMMVVLTGGTGLPIDGPAVPDWEVEKKSGLMRSKSRSSRMRCTSTEPTIPRQPIRPTCICLL